ncbi:MAG TPA: carotenoid biosynthesis protein [Prolixibacteraceae bacterium]|nr:carotenoid biosynthesis protein [Prolixibacteraceae bacterium]
MKNVKVLSIVIVVWYLVGIVGFTIPALRPFMQLLTPWGMLMATVLLMVFHEPANVKSWVMFSGIAVAGFLVELLGVNTRLLFGHYEYGVTLGPKLWNTPLVIGLNWLVLIYCVSTLLKPVRHRWYFPLAGALMMVAFDWLMEPVAMDTGMWQWAEGRVPVKNYIDWFVVSGILFLMIRLFKVEFSNRIALLLFIMQGVFFMVLNLLIQLR